MAVGALRAPTSMLGADGERVVGGEELAQCAR
jgi:hypothetical protein